MKPIGVDLAGAEVQEEWLYEAGKRLEEKGILLRYYSTKSFSPACSVSSQYIGMDDPPLSFRKKKESTLVRALHDAANETISALVTCANTGALVSAATIYLGRFPSLHHPALAAQIPTMAGKAIALDMGAFVEGKAEDLISYAFLGSALATLQHTISTPRVGLLNIGKERRKGTVELSKANEALLKHHPSFSYAGFVEPIDVFSGEVDVLVTTGFAGNIFLKTAESVASLTQGIHSYGGALLAGVKRPLIKCHGKPTMNSFMQAICQAQKAVESDLIPRLEAQFTKRIQS